MFGNEYKQVIVFRSDLILSKGKIAAQAGHAAVSASEKVRIYNKKWFKTWLKEGQRKIVVKVKNEIDLLNLEKKAIKSKLPCALIRDSGLTEIPLGTITCLGIGPAPSEKLDKITGSLPLF